jgi:hypothetical protein
VPAHASGVQRLTSSALPPATLPSSVPANTTWTFTPVLALSAFTVAPFLPMTNPTCSEGTQTRSRALLLHSGYCFSSATTGVVASHAAMTQAARGAKSSGPLNETPSSPSHPPLSLSSEHFQSQGNLMCFCARIQLRSVRVN